MSKTKLSVLALGLLSTVIAAAVKLGVLPNVCPPPPVCATAHVTSVSELLDAGTQ